MEFKFKIGDKVKTILDEIGIVDMCAIDNGNLECYYLKIKNGGDKWYKVDQLEED
jgi:cell envelope opacity-associated protein A